MSRKKRRDDKTLLVIRSALMVSLLVLLNKGAAPEELKDFNDQFNTVLLDVHSGLLSFADIIDAVHSEAGLTLKDLGWDD